MVEPFLALFGPFWALQTPPGGGGSPPKRPPRAPLRPLRLTPFWGVDPPIWALFGPCPPSGSVDFGPFSGPLYPLFGGYPPYFWLFLILSLGNGQKRSKSARIPLSHGLGGVWGIPADPYLTPPGLYLIPIEPVYAKPSVFGHFWPLDPNYSVLVD